ncbi:tetratricopeptide repeat protein [Nitrosophilus kaiyonis]|uniref:tetratricopeptide repeat protein n=1 Tax=Nitrosophilus kaiyonis TaxID=2930200 RepID=UPI0024920313|nr:hypothetical protein [Nitrosophilus kaiyonis]
MKKIILFIGIFSFVFGSNFSYAVKAYKQKDFKTAKEYFDKALIEDKANNANYFLGIMYLYGKGVKKDLGKAETYLKSAEAKGNVRAKCYLGEIYIIKYNNPIKAKKLLQNGIENGAYECNQIAKKYNINL